MPHWASGRKRTAAGRRAQSVLALGVLTGLAALMPAASASASASTTTETNGTKQECLSKLLQPPHVTKAVMLIPSKAEVLTKGSYDGVEGCDNWQRQGKYRVQIKQSGHWADLEGNFWYPTGGSDVADKNATYKFAFLAFATHDVHEQCVNGHWEPARVRFINFVKEVNTGKVVAHGKIKNQPVRIEPSTDC
jgi:hypothetical protein